ncbi:MAG TPA: alpha/beta fold hydrolase [Chthoniobacterales bacterium]|nr:alpha/beta fold hydrolase [Chthoniobacterales bacterium]
MKPHPLRLNSIVAIFGAAALGGIALKAVPAAQVEGSLEKIDCPFDSSKALLPVTCGRLKVPENYDDPQGRSIELAFMVVKAAKNIDSENPVLFLNGGPGGTSLVFAERLVTTASIRDTVVDRDWVFFDQRGAGRSNPALYCPPEDDWFKGLKTCRDQFIKQGVDLSQYNSVQSSNDMEALRKALGAKQWNLWGASYGTRLALTMARYYPSSVRSIVHDGADLPEDQEVVDDLRGTEVVLNKLFSKCAADAACSSKFPQLRSRFLAAIPRLRQQPLSIGDTRLDDGKVLSFVRDWLFGGFFMTFERRIQNLLTYMDAAARSDGELLVQIQERMTKQEEMERKKGMQEALSEGAPFPVPFPVQGKYHQGQQLSIDCNEEKSFESMDEYAQAAAKSEIVRALLGKEVGLGNFKTCALWPSGRAEPIENSHVDYDGPQLVFTGELDASLSGLAGYEIEKLYDNATNVVFRDAAHIQVTIEDPTPARDYNDYRQCAEGLARQFFADPRRKLDTRCAETRRLRLVP